MERKPFNEFQPESFESFDKLLQLGRRLNTPLESPEFVFVGPPGSGATSLIECFLGHGLTGCKTTKRPMYLHLVNNLQCATPKITLKRDTFLFLKGMKECQKDCVVPLDKLHTEIQKRNLADATAPIHIYYEHKSVWNMTLIETMGVVLPPSMKEDEEEEEEEESTWVEGEIHEGGEGGGVGVGGGAATTTTSTTTTTTTTPATGPTAAGAGGEPKKDEPPKPATAAVQPPAGTSGSVLVAGGMTIAPGAAAAGGGATAVGGVAASGGIPTLVTPEAESPAAERRRKKKDKKERKRLKKLNKQLEKNFEALVKELMPPHRYIVCIEEAANISGDMEVVIEQVDPKLERTIFVYSKFSEHLKTLTTTKDVNKFLSDLPPEAKSFCITLFPIKKKISQYGQAAQFKEKIEEAYQEDMRLLESLQYDKVYEHVFGLFSFRKHLLEMVWKHYQERIPAILKGLNEKKEAIRFETESLREKIAGMATHKLRSTATAAAMAFLRNLEKLIKGTLEGVPSQNGQTLDDEINEPEIGDWMDSMYRPIYIDPDEEDWNIPYCDNKLYGKQQFERLLLQFKAVAAHTELGPITMDEVACSTGQTKITTISNFAWCASDIVQRKSKKVLLPLVQQLFTRATFMMKRLVDVIDKMMQASAALQQNHKGSKVGARKGSDSELEPSQGAYEYYPYFAHSIRELYYQFCDETAKAAFEKCMDEFYCTQIIYWDMVNFGGHKFPEKTYDLDLAEQKEEVIELARILFKDIRVRIASNTLLKCHNFFFMPLQTDLWSAIQAKVTSLSDTELAELFQVEANKAYFKKKEAETEVEAKKLAGVESEFIRASATFSHPK